MTSHQRPHHSRRGVTWTYPEMADINTCPPPPSARPTRRTQGWRTEKEERGGGTETYRPATIEPMAIQIRLDLRARPHFSARPRSRPCLPWPTDGRKRDATHILDVHRVPADQAAPVSHPRPRPATGLTAARYPSSSLGPPRCAPPASLPPIPPPRPPSRSAHPCQRSRPHPYTPLHP